jgi:hypothetical protein
LRKWKRPRDQILRKIEQNVHLSNDLHELPEFLLKLCNSKSLFEQDLEVIGLAPVKMEKCLDDSVSQNKKTKRKRKPEVESEEDSDVGDEIGEENLGAPPTFQKNDEITTWYHTIFNSKI